MTNDAIIKQIEAEGNADKPLNIHFRQRDTIRGLFIKGYDYKDLRSKNLWRIVTNANIEKWQKTKDINLARIFNGVEFTRLSEVI
ncbi:MAG: short-chain dehydrogenase [Bacteroidetes bacterium]|nr:MAG: short-chain dehydrogenase [Bacteroidota bacterium]